MNAQRRVDPEKKQDPETIMFARRVGIVAAAALSVIALSQMLFAQATRDLRVAIDEESRARIAADTLQAARNRRTDERVERMANVMELVVIVVSEQATQSERRAAGTNLGQMRRVLP